MTKTTPKDNIKGMEFPCTITVKVFLKQGELQTHDMHALVTQAINFDDIKNIVTRPSRSETYLAFSVEVYARSKDVIDHLFRILSAHPKVIMVI